MVNTQVSLRIKSSSFSYLILYTKGHLSIFILICQKNGKNLNSRLYSMYIYMYIVLMYFNQHTQEWYNIGYKLELIIQMLLLTQNHKIYIVHAYHCVAISIANILFTNAAIPPTFRFFAFFSRIKRFIASLAMLLYVCTNDWACLVYSLEANSTRKSLFIKKGLARQVVGFVIIKTVENLYTSYMANIQSTSFEFILMPSAIISDYARLQLKK